MEYKVGDRVRVIKCTTMGEHCPNLKKIGTIVKIISGDKNNRTRYSLDIDSEELFLDTELELVNIFNGVELLERIKSKAIKDCDIEVYKNKKYQFTIQCREKAILDNPQHHIGMLTSDKYEYKPIIKKEMTISEIEKELGYSIKIVKEN